jgi:hypothetical protein
VLSTLLQIRSPQAKKMCAPIRLGSQAIFITGLQQSRTILDPVLLRNIDPEAKLLRIVPFTNDAINDVIMRSKGGGGPGFVAATQQEHYVAQFLKHSSKGVIDVLA